MPKVNDAHKENRMEQIIEAAGRCFGRKGYQATTMQEIFAEAELSAGAVYSYFKSKLDIYVALMEHNVEADLRRYRSAVEVDVDSWSKLRRLVELYMADFTDAQQSTFIRLYLMDFVPSSMSNPELAPVLQTRMDRMHSLFCEVIRQGVERQAFRPVSVEAVAALILAAGDGIRLHALAFGNRADANDMFATFVTNLEMALRRP
ncbi:MAG TPA: TetR/AcrR family transcriptional regulator [Symbiobacteriaceae bacterium]|jgi:TetR/AcrR family transcriptional regulator, transcriptional repressor of aconitase|nr:TetR/AcrR family transcriptional regulator [Symbiobacteriaceae bacterium]